MFVSPVRNGPLPAELKFKESTVNSRVTPALLKARVAVQFLTY